MVTFLSVNEERFFKLMLYRDAYSTFNLQWDMYTEKRSSCLLLLMLEDLFDVKMVYHNIPSMNWKTAIERAI